MTWQERIIAAHTAVTDAVSHGQRMQSERYFVWQEDGANDLEADGVHAEKSVTGTTDLFTKQEFDPWKEQFEAAGLPCLVLDGDGCDRSHGGEGQLATRMDAFVEMLRAEKGEGV